MRDVRVSEFAELRGRYAVVMVMLVVVVVVVVVVMGGIIRSSGCS